MAKSYYSILGIPADAARQEVKSAYRRLAKRYHPDNEGGDSRKFRDIQEAYSVLADDQKRRQYEQSRQNAKQVQVHTPPPKRHKAVYGSPEPLIPEYGGVFSARSPAGRRFDVSGRPGDDLFEWLLRNFF